MIQIDDSGSGSPVGSVGIGVFRVETGQFCFDLIPVRYFQGALAGHQEYLGQVVPIVQAAFGMLSVAAAEEVLVCRGNVFSALKLWLDCEGYTWSEARIEGPCQDLVEEAYSRHLMALGVPQAVIGVSGDYRRLNKQLERWVGESFAARAPVCKQWGRGWQRICARYAV